MKNITSEVCKKLSNWIINTVELKQPTNVIKVLSLLKLVKLLEGFLDKGLNKYLRDLISKNKTINYSSDSLLNSVLASSMVLEYGDDNHIEEVKQYFSLLFESKAFNQSPVNDIILNCMLNNVSKKKANRLDIEIPSFELDVIKMINDVLFQIEVKTKFGMDEFQNNDLFYSKIEGMTLYAIRSYDFSTAMRCMRSLKYLNRNTSIAITTAFGFIKHEQCFDGSFGDFETALSEVKDECVKRNTRIELKLVTIITILWALYEASDHENILIDQLFVLKKYLC